MFPTLFYMRSGAFWPEINIPTFMFMMMMAGLIPTFYLYFKAPKLGFSQVVALDIGMLGIFFGIVGGRLFHVFFENWHFYKDDLGRILEVWRGGFVSYGAFIGGGLAVALYIKIRKLDFKKHIDFVALSLPLCVILIRIGCLGAGCCYGKPTDFFIHLIFDRMTPGIGQPNLQGLPLHATQIYEMIYGAFIFYFNVKLYPRKKFDGQIFLLFFMLYAFFRFFQEFLRGDGDRVLYFNDLISTGQIVSVGVMIFCVIVYVGFFRGKKNSTPV